MLRKVLVANRSEIAVRVIRACFDERIPSVAVHSDADAESLPVWLADEAVRIGPASAAESYLSVEALICAALASGCDALHPGYGFLSERPELAEACARHGITFVGPGAETIRRGGDKVAARELARSLGVPVGAGSDAVATAEDALLVAKEVGYPVLLKAAAGGGGRGMVRVDSDAELVDGFDRASAEARQAFGDGRLFVERYVGNARHVEVQVLADAHGGVVHLGDRDCSAQRRYQKLVEEAPASAVPPAVRRDLGEAAVEIARALDYRGAGTVEFLFDADRDSFAFLEVNTRVQVEHPVTEVVTGVDIVREQLRVAGGAPLSVRQNDIEVRGHAIECRINAENARQGFAPSPGRIERWVVPQGSGVRMDSHCFPGYRVPPHYDSLLGKLICSGATRAHALSVLDSALSKFTVDGVATTVDFHRALVAHPRFRSNQINTRWVESEFLPAWAELPSTVRNGAA